MESFILVEMILGTKSIGSVVRAYTSRPRAAEDLALMQEMLPGRYFDILAVEHIDN